jgi:streptomycin 6-kinase
MSLLAVPDLVVQRATSAGDVGRRWLGELPDVVDRLSAAWGLTLDSVFEGGTSGYVVAATDSTGRQCVLKVTMVLGPDDRDAFACSLRAHQLAAGRGCAELLSYDLVAPAMLLERLGPNLAELSMEVPQILELLAATLRSFWRPVTDPHGLQRGDVKARWLARFIADGWDELQQPCDRAVIDHALALCERRAVEFDPRRAVLVHGDAHGWNTLAVGDGTYKFVDVEGLWSEPEHDLAVAMREYNDPLLLGDTARLARDRAASLAESCDVVAQAVWEWGFIERVSTGLANLRHFDNESGTTFLEVASRCM